MEEVLGLPVAELLVELSGWYFWDCSLHFHSKEEPRVRCSPQKHRKYY